MEYQHSASAAVVPLATGAVRSHLKKVEPNASQPGDQIVVNEDTFIIEADGGMIPVPAGTVATLLPDSDDDTQEEKEPASNSCEPVSISQDTEVDMPSYSNCQSNSEVHLVPLSVEELGLTAQPESETVCNLPVQGNSVDETVSLEASGNLPVQGNSVADTVSLVASDSVNVQANLLAETVSLEASDSTVTMNEECSVAIECSEDTTQSSLSSDEPFKNRDVSEEASQIPANASISISDLYVQEEEEVTMDETSTDVKTVSCELQSVDSPIVSALASKSGSESSTQSKNNKKTYAKKSVKNTQALQLEKVEISESVGTKLVTKENVANVQHTLVEQTKSMSPALPTVSASGRPQRSTPRRSAIDLLKGTDAVKPIRRSAADSESDGPAAKVTKVAVHKKNAEPTSVSSPVEEKTLSETALPRGRGRRKPTDTVSIANSYAQLQTGSSSPIIEKNQLDTVISNYEGVNNGMDYKLLDNVALSDNLKSETISNERKEVSREKTGLADKDTLAMDDAFLSDDICETKKASGDDEEQGRLNDFNKKTPKKTNHELGDVVSSKEDSVTTSSVQRGRPKKPVVNNITELEDKLSNKKPDEDNSDCKQDTSQHRLSLAELDSVEAASEVVIDNALSHSDTVGRRSGNSLAKTSGLPGFPYHSFTMGNGGKKIIAEVISRTKGMKVRHRKEKLVNQIGASKESNKNVLDINQAKMPNIESMQARIRELEAQVDMLQAKLDDVGKPDVASGVDKSEITSSVAKDSTAVSTVLETDEISRLARWENKLRKLDMELDEKRTELIIRLGCITRYERQVLEKERRLKRLEHNLTIRKQTVGHMDDVPKDVVAVKDVPLLMTGRVDLHAEEHKLELRRQELERQKSFLEDEKKKLVAKERELETREQAAMDADLMSMASVFKTSDASLAVISTVKQSNGKIEVQFSDEDDDGFGADTPQFDSALAAAVRLPTPNALSEDDEFSGRDEDISFPKVCVLVLFSIY